MEDYAAYYNSNVTKEYVSIGTSWAFVTMDRGVVFFRLFGWGLWFATYATHRPLFSERNGYSPGYRLTERWRFRILKPRRIA